MSKLTYGKAAYVGKAFNSKLKDIDVSPHLDSQRMISRPIGGSIRKRASRSATVNSFRTFVLITIIALKFTLSSICLLKFLLLECCSLVGNGKQTFA